MATDPIHVRTAAPDDARLILELIRGLASYEKLSDQVIATEERLREHLFGERRYAEALIAEHDGLPAGYALFFHSYSTFLALPGLFLEDLFVLPELRARGIGRALLQALAKLAVERGYGRVEWAVLDWNDPAIGFYRSIGAEPVAGWTSYRLAGDALRRLGG